MRNILKIKKKGVVSVLVIIMANAMSVKSQVPVIEQKDSLQKLCLEIWKQESDTAKIAMSDKFASFFKTFLTDKKLPANALDAIKGIMHVKSADNHLQIYTWNIPFADGSFVYRGFIKHNDKIMELHSAENSNKVISNEILDVNRWYGALYYKIIDTEIKGKKIYTLLAWDGYNARQDRKLIDILSIRGDDISFGAPVFKTKEGLKNRVVIDYADRGNMLVRYDKQYLRIEKGKKITKEKRDFIVLDRLHPIIPEYENNKSFYVPSGEFYDAYMIMDGYWVFVEDIEVSNTPK